jgi:Rps23 Pro-64 3,4-dihydroxylase Tpa1-like proline 4-hydroxylase
MTSPAGRFLPHATVADWLAPDMAEALLDFAIARERDFSAGLVYDQSDPCHDPDRRQTQRLRVDGPLRKHLKARALDHKPALERAFGVPPFDVRLVEVELAAHGDGAHFERHTDTFAGRHGRTTRVLTLVLYLHRRPRGFEGGALRLHALGGPAVRDLEPDHNMLVAFPSFLPHSVQTVRCPSGSFADRRFAVNIWLHG